MTKTELLTAIVQKQDELIDWLVKYTEPESFRYDRFCDQIKDLKQQLAECEEKKQENNCNNCKWGICLTKDWPCNDCNGSNKWEPIKTE